MQEDIVGRVIRVIAATQHIPAETITATSSFEDLKIDSLDGINIVFALENEFDVSIPDDDLKSIRGVPEVAEGISRLLKQKAEAG
jgi:acyl carrier protein